MLPAALSGNFLLLSSIVLISCGPVRDPQPAAHPSANSPAAASPAPDTLGTQSGTVFADSVVSQIIGYYSSMYGNDSTLMQRFDMDSVVELRFAGSTGTDGDGQTLLVASIPVPDGRQTGLRGDLNGDGLADMLISVPTEGGGGGGNVYWADHFVFLATAAGNYIFQDAQSDSELIGAPGYFSAESIDGGVITGSSNEYDEDDGHCCPSLHYQVKLRFEKNRLIRSAKVLTGKPAQAQ